jgi:hypothetical protein
VQLDKDFSLAKPVVPSIPAKSRDKMQSAPGVGVRRSLSQSSDCEPSPLIDQRPEGDQLFPL